MRILDPKECEVGMITAADIKTPIGQILCPAGTELTRQLINRMKLYRVETVLIEEDDSATDAIAQVIQEATAPIVQESVTPALQEAVAPVTKTYAEGAQTHSQKVAASSEFREFQLQYFQAINELKTVFSAVKDRNQQLDASKLLASVGDLFRSRNTIIELFDMLYNMRIVEDAIYAHSINVGLISRMIGRWLRLDAHDLDVLTLAGLLHDIGKTLIPEEVLNKPGTLTDEEFTLIKQHPKLGYDILKNQNIDPHVKKAALMHHERSDGSGYPTGVEEDFIDEYAMIVGIADVYDAMTTARSYRAPLCPFQVIRTFEDEGYQKYKTKYLITFLKQIAATYQSNRVILNDGRGCNIVLLNQSALSRPMVQLDDGTIIDLNTQRDLYIKSVL